jgi:exopolysaccharide production protein ExoQ
MRIRRKLLGDSFTVAVLFLSTGAFQSLVIDLADPRTGTDGSRFLQSLWFAVYAVVISRLVPHYRQIVALVRANKCLLLLVLLAVCSILWSDDPGLTFRRGVALLATTLVGIDFAVRYSVRDQVRLVCIVLGSVVLFGIVAQLFFPTLMPSPALDSAAWHGVSGHKNEFARTVVLATVALLSRSRRSLRDFVLTALAIVVAFGLVILAHSAGALVVLIALLSLFRIFGALRWRPKILVTASLASALIVLPISYLAFQNLDKVTALLGRDASLTGRVGVWQLALTSIANNPIHGYGYSAFWDADSQAATRIREELNWGVPHGHNGYIDMTLELGFAGLLLLLAGYVLAARRATDYFQRGVEREAIWPLIFLSFFFLYQLNEGSIVAGNTIYWILYVAMCFSVTKVTVAHEPALQSDREFAVPVGAFSLGQERS